MILHLVEQKPQPDLGQHVVQLAGVGVAEDVHDLLLEVLHLHNTHIEATQTSVQKDARCLLLTVSLIPQHAHLRKEFIEFYGRGRVSDNHQVNNSFSTYCTFKHTITLTHLCGFYVHRQEATSIPAPGTYRSSTVFTSQAELKTRKNLEKATTIVRYSNSSLKTNTPGLGTTHPG